MGLISLVKAWVDNEKVNYTDLNGNFDNIVNEMNGNLDNANIDAAADIAPTKILGTAATLTATQTLTNKTLTAPQIGGDADLDDAGGNITVAGADPKRAIYVPASAMWPSTTQPCGPLLQTESSTNKVNIKTLDFDGAGTTKEYAEFGIQSPLLWDAGTVLVQFVWYASAGSGTVNWEIQGLALSDDDALDAAYGTLQEVTDTLTAIGDVMISAETSAVTIAGTPVAGDWLQFRVARDPANDTNTSDAKLMGIKVKFALKQYNDA